MSLECSVYINSSLLRKHQQTSLKAASNAAAESVIHPLPSLFRLLGLTSFKKVRPLVRYNNHFVTFICFFFQKKTNNKKNKLCVHACDLRARLI